MQFSSQKITQKSRSNLALSFICLSKEKRAAMSTFYAFCRVVDDIVDREPTDPIQSRKELDHWRDQIHKCYTSTPDEPLALELAEIIRTYLIPPQFLFDIIDGMEMDLNPRRYADFSELEAYCYKVASAVGLVSINLFGCKRAQSREYAVALGMALQLTNILRDVRCDLKLGRVYLPQDEMIALGVTENDLLESVFSPRVQKLLRLQYLRARHYFAKAERLIHPEDKKHLLAAQIMANVYRRVLERLREINFQLTDPPLRLSKFEKARIVAKTCLQFWLETKVRPWLRIKGLDNNKKPKHVAIWGGGFAGLSAATHLTVSGNTVDLYEAKAYWGGKAHSFKEAKSGDTIDNGQHIFLGCYSSCMELFDLLGVADKLKKEDSLSLAFVSVKNGGHPSYLKAKPWRAPWHLISALFHFKELRLKDKWSIMRLGWKLCFRYYPNANFPEPTETVFWWLKRLKQTDGAIRALWEPLCLAALNEPIQTASAKLFLTVIHRSIFGGKSDSAIYISRVGLSELLMPEVELLLKSTGGKAHLSCGVRSIAFSENQKQVLSFQTTDHKVHPYDAYISALNWQAIASLLPEKNHLKEIIDRIESSPILNIHFWTRNKITDEPITGLLDSPIHWLFDRTSEQHRQRGEYYYAIVVSGAYALASTPVLELVQLAKKELERAFPKSSPIELIHQVVYKSKDATFAAHPGTEVLRPGAVTPWKNLYLIGDWTRTDLPATLEGAVESGEEVVQYI